MRRISQSVDIRKLTCGLKQCAGVLGHFPFGYEPLLFNAENINCAHDADSKEGKLIRNISGVLVENLENL